MSTPDNIWLSDERIEHLGEIFVHLDTLYSLVIENNYTFNDFLAQPNEIAIHQYFANKHLFQNRRYRMPILLQMFLSNPDEILIAALNVDCAYREAEGLRCEQLLTRQIIFAIANMAWWAEQNDARFERTHRVLLRDDKLVEPFTHYHRCERKQAGGKR